MSQYKCMYVVCFCKCTYLVDFLYIACILSVYCLYTYCVSSKPFVYFLLTVCIYFLYISCILLVYFLYTSCIFLVYFLYISVYYSWIGLKNRLLLVRCAISSGPTRLKTLALRSLPLKTSPITKCGDVPIITGGRSCIQIL